VNAVPGIRCCYVTIPKVVNPQNAGRPRPNGMKMAQSLSLLFGPFVNWRFFGTTNFDLQAKAVHDSLIFQDD
jgi:hypothetical protein